MVFIRTIKKNFGWFERGQLLQVVTGAHTLKSKNWQNALGPPDWLVELHYYLGRIGRCNFEQVVSPLWQTLKTPKHLQKFVARAGELEPSGRVWQYAATRRTLNMCCCSPTSVATSRSSGHSQMIMILMIKMKVMGVKPMLTLTMTMTMNGSIAVHDESTHQHRYHPRIVIASTIPSMLAISTQSSSCLNS